MSDYESESAASSDSESSIVDKKVTKPKSSVQKHYLPEEEEDDNASASESGSEVGSEAGSESAAGSDDDDDDLDELPSDDELFGDTDADGNAQTKPKPVATEKKGKKVTKKAAAQTDELEQEYFQESDYSEDEDDEDVYGEEYLQKFDDTIRDAILENHHQDLLHHNYIEVEALTLVVRDDRGIIIDPLHRTMPMLTKYEKARVLGERAKQINGGAKPFVKVREGVIDGYLIACDELEQKKMPFIIRRPINGGFEYWRMKDLEVLF